MTRYTASQYERPTPLAMPLQEHINSIYQTIYRHSYPGHNGQEPRPHHGILHVVRTAIYVPALFNLYKKHFLEEVTALHESLAEKGLSFSDAGIIKILQIVMLLHDSAREADGVDEWEEESRLNCFDYLHKIAGLSPEAAKLFADTITHNEGKRVNLLGKIVHDADAFDIKRARKQFCIEYLHLYQRCEGNQAAKNDLICLDADINTLLAYQGDDRRRPYPRTRMSFQTKEDHEQSSQCYKMTLFVTNLYCKNLIALSTPKGYEAVCDHPVLRQTRRYLKTIKPSHWEEFLESMTRSPLNYDQPPLRKARKAGNACYSIRPRLDDTGRTVTYAVDERKSAQTPAMYGPEQKSTYSSFTSLTLIDPLRGYEPVSYKASQRKVGVLFDPEDVLVNRYMMYFTSTFKRGYEHSERHKAEAWLERHKSQLFATPDETISGAKSMQKKNLNEVLGRVKYSPKFTIALLEDSKDAIAAARIFAMKLYQRLQAWAYECQQPFQEPTFNYVFYCPGSVNHLNSINLGTPLAEPVDFAYAPVHIAAAHGDMQRLESGIDLDAVDEKRRTALHYAAANGHADALLYCLNYAFVLIDQVDCRGHDFIQTALKKKQWALLLKCLTYAGEHAQLNELLVKHHVVERLFIMAMRLKNFNKIFTADSIVGVMQFIQLNDIRLCDATSQLDDNAWQHLLTIQPQMLKVCKPQDVLTCFSQACQNSSVATIQRFEASGVKMDETALTCSIHNPDVFAYFLQQQPLTLQQCKELVAPCYQSKNSQLIHCLLAHIAEHHHTAYVNNLTVLKIAIEFGATNSFAKLFDIKMCSEVNVRLVTQWIMNDVHSEITQHVMLAMYDSEFDPELGLQAINHMIERHYASDLEPIASTLTTVRAFLACRKNDLFTLKELSLLHSFDSLAPLPIEPAGMCLLTYAYHQGHDDIWRWLVMTSPHNPPEPLPPRISEFATLASELTVLANENAQICIARIQKHAADENYQFIFEHFLKNELEIAPPQSEMPWEDKDPRVAISCLGYVGF